MLRGLTSIEILLTHDSHGESSGETEVVAESPAVVQTRSEVDGDAEAGDEELGPD